METKLFLINHFKVFHSAVDAVGALANLDLKNFSLSVSREGLHYNFFPQFLVFKDGKKTYTPRFSPDVNVFIGWLPYFNKRWDLSNEKLKFKAYCEQNGIPTPEYTVDRSKVLRKILIKGNISSFGCGIRGPFPSSDGYNLGEGEFFESFIPGKILKIWYWNGKAVCVESQNMPAIIGDGISTLRQMLEMRLDKLGRKSDMDEILEFLTFQGETLDSIIPENKRFEIDFRYGSVFGVPRFVDTWGEGDEGLRLMQEELDLAGLKFWEGIPEAIRENTLFTIDAVKDNTGKLWFLEMNSNPFTHPLAYPYILDTLFLESSCARPHTENEAAGAFEQTILH
jgi:hypothetical protein